MIIPPSFTGPHQQAKVFTAGTSLQLAKAVMIMIHGRGATATGILQLADEFAQPDFHYIAPQANGGAWYPYSFLESRTRNQPGLDSALKLGFDLIDSLVTAGMKTQKIMLLGFSQGACLVSDLTVRRPQKFGGIIALSGGLIGSEIQKQDYTGSLEHTPVFMGCSDYDPHIPQSRIEETAEVFEALSGRVDKRIYPGMGHTINEDEVKAIRGLMAGVLTQ